MANPETPAQKGPVGKQSERRVQLPCGGCVPESLLKPVEVTPRTQEYIRTGVYWLKPFAYDEHLAQEGADAPAPSGAGATPLPCLETDSSTEGILSKSHWKSSKALAENVRAFVEKYGLDRVAFHTETFADHVVDMKEASRRFNSLRTHVLAVRYLDYIAVVERQKSGRIHFHLLVACRDDIRTGFNFEAYDNARRAGNPDTRAYWTKIYAASATEALREEWRFWREMAPRYGFGRCELTPIRSTAEAIGKYVGKYIRKHIEKRKPEDKGARLVRYSKRGRSWSTRFSSLGVGAKLWRRKLAQFCRLSGLTWEQLAKVFGPRWAWHLAPILDCMLLEIDAYETGTSERGSEFCRRDVERWGNADAQLVSWCAALRIACSVSSRFKRHFQNHREAVAHWKPWRLIPQGAVAVA